jgi:hypothetical protein
MLILALCFSFNTKANMGDPVSHGTLGTRPFLNQYVEIIKEDLYIKIDKNFKRAYIKAIYYIKSQKDGIKIPLLFYASDYQEDFIVKVDGKTVEIKEIPYEYKVAKDTKFKDFDYFFKVPSYSDKSEVSIDESTSNGFYVSLNDMKYFETDIAKGEHVIEVTYTSKKWTDGWNWINEYSFRYALSPAKYWKSFGELNITIDASDFKERLQTNLGNPISGDIDKSANWKFNEIPVDVIHITYMPKISWLSRILLFIRPLGASFLFGLLIIFLHYKVVKSFRRKYSTKKYNWIVIFGSIIAPVIILLFWLNYIEWLKLTLGVHAGMGIDPYSTIYIPMLFYPVILIFYWFIMWRIDKRIKNNVAQHY